MQCSHGIPVLKSGQFAMLKTCENWLSLVNSYVYYAHQILKIYYVLPYTVDIKASDEFWNPLGKTVRPEWAQLENLSVVFQQNCIPRTLKRKVWLFATGHIAWWRHQMETFSALLAVCAGNSPVPGEFPSQRPVTRSFDVFFDLRLNKRLSKQS